MMQIVSSLKAEPLGSKRHKKSHKMPKAKDLTDGMPPMGQEAESH